MIMDLAMARKKGVAFYRDLCTVDEVGYDGRDIFLSGPDGHELRGSFKPGQLAVPKDAGWLPLHLALAEGREEGVVQQVRDAWPEAVGIGPRAMCYTCLLYTSPSPRDRTRSRMPSSA